MTSSRSGGDAAVDLAQRGSCAAVAEALAPDFVVNLAALSRMDACESDPELAFRVNAWLPGELAERFGNRLLHVSTDLVFDGSAAPYCESDVPSPSSAYGRSKLEGERAAREHGGRVVRVPLLFGRNDGGKGASEMVRRAIAEGRQLSLFTNEYRTPLHAADAGLGLAELATLRAAPQMLHLPGPERCSRWDFGRRLCSALGLDATLLLPVECQDAMRPRDVSLRGDWTPQRTLDEMLADC